MMDAQEAVEDDGTDREEGKEEEEKNPEYADVENLEYLKYFGTVEDDDDEDDEKPVYNTAMMKEVTVTNEPSDIRNNTTPAPTPHP